MSSSYRPRRTRIYGANYDIGESYYKKQLQDLDQKRDPFARQQREVSFDDSLFRRPKVSFSSADDKDDLKFTKPNPFRSAYVDNDDGDEIFSKYQRRDAFFKQKSPTPVFEGRARSKARLFAENDEADFVGSRKSKFKSFIEDNDDESFTLPPRKTKFRNLFEDEDLAADFPSRKSKFRSLLDDSTGNSLNEDSAASSVVFSKKISKVSRNIVDAGESAETRAATSRAAKTKARLADLEDEMENLSIRHNEREKRSLHLKQLLRDSESVDVTL